MSGTTPLSTDRDHFDKAHERWIQHIHWDRYGPDADAAWQGKQCLTCLYYIPLTGIFGGDYGACSNAASPLDGTIRFEHDGCEAYEENEQYWD